LLWTALITFPLMATVQEICDRTALATGKGLGELAVERFTRWWRPVLAILLAALIGANVLNITADLLAVGSGMSLLHAGPTWVWALLAGAIVTALVVASSFPLIANVFKVLTVALFAYIVEVFTVHLHWPAVLRATVTPHLHFSKSYVALFVAVLGTTISPYLFFWQGAHRKERLSAEPERGDQPVSLKQRTARNAKKTQVLARTDVFTGMAMSNLVMWAIILTTASTLWRSGKHDIQSAAQAAQALQPVAGRFSTVLFALGFISTGILTVPVLAGSGAAGMAGLLGKKWGFSRSIKEAPVFYGLVGLGTLGGTALSLLHFNPIKLLVIVAVINGVAAGPFLVLILLIANDRKVMGKFHNRPLANILGWLTVALMVLAAVALFV
jgi:Mn2+/Fe2+ NRAMP family transporter